MLPPKLGHIKCKFALTSNVNGPHQKLATESMMRRFLRNSPLLQSKQIDNWKVTGKVKPQTKSKCKLSEIANFKTSIRSEYQRKKEKRKRRRKKHIEDR